MQKKQLILPAAVLAVLIGAGGAASLFMKYQHQEQAASDSLDDARAALAEAKDPANAKGSRDAYVRAARLATQAAAASSSCAFDAACIEAEALLGATQTKRAIDAVERALLLNPQSVEARTIAARAYHRSYEVSRKDGDFAAAMRNYESAMEKNETAALLKGAFTLAEGAGKSDLADGFAQRLESKFSGTPEQADAAAAIAARKPKESSR